MIIWVVNDLPRGFGALSSRVSFSLCPGDMVVSGCADDIGGGGDGKSRCYRHGGEVRGHVGLDCSVMDSPC